MSQTFLNFERKEIYFGCIFYGSPIKMIIKEKRNKKMQVVCLFSNQFREKRDIKKLKLSKKKLYEIGFEIELEE